ncbi:soluble lytic murein transglycosylase [Malonomonas rubra DSM 5091]|uniref:Soluble lytic murein transglycosylase n=1 Tax=Malonomonas rubra DSM 5091 TaxID=1122189 RepID=A0A1M6K9V0_MALRU|nr:lytic transglycosylase domain-containing protein [Malonomonas rubra]SHJ55692.1 soluble lytic murein transglycosylase [Malonomonas rubra DSM 5091]
MLIKRLHIFIAAAFMLFGFCSDAAAAIYRYVDANGQLHFTNVPTGNHYRLYRGDRDGNRIEDLIEHFASKFRLESALVKAVIKVESNFNPSVVSHKGAQGLMQLMPGTAREVGVSNPFDPRQSIYGGSLYLRKMLDSFNFNLDYALAAYNAGPSAVRKYGGIPPYKETQNYVKRVKKYIDYYRREKVIN